MKQGIFVVLLAALLAAGCDDRGDESVPVTPLSADAPDDFLHFVNTAASLPAGDYEIVAATTVAGKHGFYQLEITTDDGSVTRLTGQWAASGGEDPSAAGNPRHAIRLEKAGGLRVAMTSMIDGYLYLVRKGGQVIAEDDNSGGGTDPLIDLAASNISSVDYANAYYDAVDPDDERATLEDFQRRNCFIAGNPDCAGETIGYDAHVVFRDSKDLGYGRNMYARRNSDGTIAFFVSNYVILLQQGSSTNYGPVNVDAAVDENHEFLRGTNAIEFSPIDPANPASEKIARFFTYNPAGQRITSADLDGRGVKHVPGACFVCHGGRTLPVATDGTFPVMTLRSPKLNLLELDTFDYSTKAGYSRAEQEAAFRTINRLVYDSYVEMKDNRPASDPGKWWADYAMDVAAGHYGGAAFPSTTYVEGYVPAGWQQTLSRPEGVETLYTRVIEPHCSACHGLQGSAAGQNISDLANAVNFSSWEKFISYREKIIDYVFRRGVMPLSLRNFEAFWRNPQEDPALLASFLDEPALFDAHGEVIPPGRPVARAGADRTLAAPVQLDGSASQFAQAYLWQVIDAPVVADYALDDNHSAVPVFTTDTDGDYTLQLTVMNAAGETSTDTVVVTIDSAAAAAGDLRFATDIQPLLENPIGSSLACTSCHRSPTGYAGIPVSYRASDNPNVYEDVRARVNFAEAENSLLLVKPTGVRHGGGVVIDTTTPEGQAAYNTLLNWIRAGAPQ